jgi:uncharacterized membrane protein (DUF106 family)
LFGSLFDPILDPIILPLLRLKPFYAVAIISFGITLMITLIYRYTTDQDTMKHLKKKQKDFQVEMKKHRDDPNEMMKIQKKAMASNMEYMKHSMRSTLFTMIPILIIFGYLTSHLGFFPIVPGESFTTTVEFKEGVEGEISLNNPNLEYLNGQEQTITDSTATWELRGDEGEYVLEYEFEGRTFEQELKITDERVYKTPEVKVRDDAVKVLRINNEKIIAMNLFGWKLGWLGTYIILSIVFSTIIRKVMKVH